MSGRVPVLVGATFEGGLEKQANLMNTMGEFADSVVIITNQIATMEEVRHEQCVGASCLEIVCVCVCVCVVNYRYNCIVHLLRIMCELSHALGQKVVWLIATLKRKWRTSGWREWGRSGGRDERVVVREIVGKSEGRNSGFG